MTGFIVRDVRVEKMTEEDYRKASDPEGWSLMERIRYLEKKVEFLLVQCPQFAGELHSRIDNMAKVVGASQPDESKPDPGVEADALLRKAYDYIMEQPLHYQTPPEQDDLLRKIDQYLNGPTREPTWTP